MFNLWEAGALLRPDEPLLQVQARELPAVREGLFAQLQVERELVLGLHAQDEKSARAFAGGGAMLKDKFGQCIVCFFDPCACRRPRESGDRCSQCAMLRDEVDALRRELRRYAALVEIEKDRRFYLERELLLTRVPPFRGSP